MSTKHTPGPWRVGDAGHTVFGPKESDGKLPQRIGEVCGVRESYLANARLIAAAPDTAHAAKTLAILSLQSDRYSKDMDFRDAVDAVLALTQEIEL